MNPACMLCVEVIFPNPQTIQSWSLTKKYRFLSFLDRYHVTDPSSKYQAMV